MPNYCDFDMTVVAKNPADINKLYNIMQYKDKNIQMYRVLDVEKLFRIKREGEFYSCRFFGDVAWSCLYWIEKNKRFNDIYVLPELCKMLNIGVEIWSRETGVGFQEHILVNSKGEVKINECKNYEEIWTDENGKDLDEPIKKGGFYDYGEFMKNEDIFY